MLPNVAPLWETLLAAMKLGVVVVPSTTQLSRADLANRLERGEIRHVVTDAEGALGRVGRGFDHVVVVDDRGAILLGLVVKFRDGELALRRAAFECLHVLARLRDFLAASASQRPHARFVRVPEPIHEAVLRQPL